MIRMNFSSFFHFFLRELLVLGCCCDFRFKTSRNSHVIEVNLYDEIDFICPYTPFEFNTTKQEFYIVYQVHLK